jgi:DNA-binding Lrp family transcriptional regulator
MEIHAMHAKAYVLIEAEAGHVGQVIAALQILPGVTHVDAVTGPYDIIVTIETSDPRDVGRLVMNQIHGVTGIKRTITCLTI